MQLRVVSKDGCLYLYGGIQYILGLLSALPSLKSDQHACKAAAALSVHGIELYERLLTPSLPEPLDVHLP